MKKNYKVFRYFLSGQNTLKDYTPKDRHFTSEKEIKTISEALSLKYMDVEDMREMRNMVVVYYNYLIGDLQYGDKLYDRYWNAMMSVTAIIDHVSHGETA